MFKLIKLFAAAAVVRISNERGAVQITDISAILKKVIKPQIVPQLRREALLYDQIKRNVGVTVMNNNIYIAARSGRHSGIYSVAEGTEPYTGKAAYIQPVAPIRYSFGTVEFSDQALAAADKNGPKAIAAILATEIMALKDDFRMDINRVMHGAGTGKLCLANGAGSPSTTLIVDGNPNGGDGTEYLAAGMYIEIGSSGAKQITSVDSATQCTIASATWSDNDVVTKASDAEPMGIAGIIDDGDNVSTIQGLARASYPILNSNVDDTSEALSEADMITMYLRAKKNGFTAKTGVILMGETMYQAYGALLTSMKRSTTPKPVLSGGWTGLEFMDGVPVVFDPDTWSGYVQFVHLPSLTIGEMSDPMEWLEADAHGGVLMRSSSNRTVWEGTLKYYYNLVGLRFNSQSRLSGKTA
jgi:hypothetical protein